MNNKVMIGGIGSVPGLTSKNLINMGRISREKNESRISITYEDPFYIVKGFKNGMFFQQDFDKFKLAKDYFNKMYKTF